MITKKGLQINDLKLLLVFLKFMRPFKKWVMFALLSIPFTISASVLIPLLLVKIVDDYIIVGNLSGLYQMTSVLAGVVLMGYIFDGTYTYSLQKAGHLSIAEMRKTLFTHTLSLPRSYFDKNPVGVTLSRLTSDMETMGESIAMGVLALFTDFFKTVTLFIFLFYLNWQLALIISIVLPVVYIVVSIIRKRLRYYFNTAREAIAEATSFLQECLNGIKTIQLFAAEEKVVKEFKKKNKRFLKAQTKSNIYDASLFSIIDSLTSVTMALIIWYGTGQILAKIITIGVLIGFINTLNKIFIPIREFAQQIALIQRALAALEHVNKLLAEKPEETEDQVRQNGEFQFGNFEKLTFDNVSFRYTPAGNKVLNNISFQLKKGEKIALVGATGSGKSTILKLLTKTYGNYEGSVRLNNIELSDIPKDALNNAVTMMQQDVYLFNESLAFNISLERGGIRKKNIVQAAEYVHASEFISQIPEGFDFQVIDNGKNLSAGQAQLISFARAIAGQNELILLDEATSSVDSVTEDLIQKAIEKIFRERTVIAVAHRLSTIRHSDRILVIKDGQIIEQGNHDDLIKENGHYVKLLSSMEHIAA